MAEPFSFLILAGGKSRRMGRPKAELPWGEGTFLDACVVKGLQLGAAEVLLSGPFTHPSARTVPDIVRDIGPLGGISACLRASATEVAAVLSVDTPQVPASLYQAMLEAFPPAAHCLMLYCGGGYEPLISLFRRSALPRLEQAVEQGIYSVVRAVEPLGITPFFYTGDPAKIRGCNTPEEYFHFQKNQIPPEKSSKIVNFDVKT